MKRKIHLIIAFTVAMTICLCACGSNSDGSGGGIIKKNTLEGFWTDGNITTVTIDGDIGCLVWGGTPYKCTIDKDAKTITASKYSWDGSDSVYSYEFVNDELKLSTDNKESLNDTIILAENKDSYTIEKRDTPDGKWTNGNITSLSIEGESGFLTWGGTDYSCTVNNTDKTIIVKKYSWDQSDVTYNYSFVQGRLLLYTDKENSLDGTIWMIPTEVYEQLQKKAAENDAAAENSGADNENSNADKDAGKSSAPSIEGANELSKGYFIIGEDIKPGIYDFGPVSDEDGEGYFSIKVYEKKEYYDQANGDAEGNDYIDHYESYYGDEAKRGISLKKGNILEVDYHGVLYKKQEQ